MTAIEGVLREPVAQAIGWALVHFIWQGTLVGVLAAVALRVLRRSDADVRYVVAAIALAVMATLPVVTGVQTYHAATAVAPARLTTEQPATVAEAAPQTTLAATALEQPLDPSPAVDRWTLASVVAAMRDVEPWIPMLVLGWLLGVAFLTLRLLSGWIRVQRMKSHGATAAASSLQASVVRLSKQLHIYRPVQLLQSSRVDVPTVIGWMTPVILLPVSALSGLSHSQVEAILAHELAHIRRHDYLVNLLQALLETLLFYHPAVWWLSRRIRAERENCCDDLAVSLCGDPVAYARALADLEELRGVPRQLAMAASGGPLLQRVHRLLLATPASHDGRGPVWVAGATALLLIFSLGLAVVSHAHPAEALAPVATIGDAGQVPPPVPPAPPVPANQAVAPAPPAPPAPAGTPGAAPTPPAPPVPAASRPSQVPVPPAPPAPPPPKSSRPSEPSVASVPAPPSVPSAPSAPAAPAAPQGTSRSGNHISWSNNGEKLEIKWSGDFELSDDDTDIRSMTPGAELRISDGGWFRGRSVEFTADASGKITRRYWVGSTEHPFEPEGKAWLTKSLPRFVRESGIGAKGRVARIHKARGVTGVLAEITAISSNWVKKVYFTELLSLDITPDARRQALEQAGREISSDYELASLLISQGDRFLADAATRKAYFDAARSIDSDYEMRRVFSAAVKRGPLEKEHLASMLDASRSIESNYELASLLVDVVKQQSIEPARTQFFAALGTIGSSYDRGRVLQALTERTDNSGETTAAMLSSVNQSGSDYETAQFLLKFLKRPLDASLRDPFFRAVNSLGSTYERGRVLKAVVAQPTLPQEDILAVIKSVRAMSGDYETSQVLQQLAAKHAITGPARDAYIEATEALGDYEQGKALSALVKSDRARK